MSKYAKGRHAVAECQRSGQKMRYRDLVEDGHIEGLLVHPDWWEPKHPQEIPVTVTDPIALYRPAPEISIEAGYGDPENLDGGETPTGPASGDLCGTLAQAVNVGDTQIVVNEAVTYTIGQWLFIQRDDLSYFISRITTTANSPSFTIPFTTPYSGGAVTANNTFCWGDGFIIPATQTITVTVANYNTTQHGFTLYGTNQGSTDPARALLTVEDGLTHQCVEITFYAAGGGVEFFFDTQDPDLFVTVPPVDQFALLNFDTFSSIEVDHPGGTLVLDTRDTGSGGDMNQGASTQSVGYSTFFFPTPVPKVWDTPAIGNDYDVRFIV